MREINTNEAAERLGVTTASVLQYIRDGRLKARRLTGTVWAIDPQSVTALRRELANLLAAPRSGMPGRPRLKKPVRKREYD